MDSESRAQNIISFIGSCTCLYFVLFIARRLWKIFIWSGSIKPYAQKGSWAIVTGCTDGIGLEFARQLAQKGLNTVLISRNPEKLGVVAAELESKHNVQTKTVALDFTSPTEKAYQGLASMLEGLDISVLVNNVGKSHDMPVPFHETPIEEMSAIIAINVTGTLRITHLVLPYMLKRSKRSLILNLSSISGFIPTPLLATYSGSKAFLGQWTLALKRELSGTNVDVKVIRPYFVVSAMSKIRKASFMVPSPKTYVRATLASVGRSSPVIGARYWVHELFELVVELVGPTTNYVVSQAHNVNASIRKRALKKLEREKAKSD